MNGEKNKIRKKIVGTVVILAIMITLFVYWRLPSNWKEKILFPVNMPHVATVAVTNHTNNHIFDEKIWIHRVNSVERAKIMTQKYKGIEMDIIWEPDSNHFYVAHDPNPEIYLPLDKMFEGVDNIQEHYFWLDFKNLDEENAVLALGYLLKLVAKYKINQKNIIVESMDPYLLSDFTTAGFTTSFYLPTWDFNPYVASEKVTADYAKNIDAMLLKSNVNFLSSDYLSYRFIKKYFPDSQILLWHLENNRFTPYVRKKLIGDDHVHVVLVDEFSEGYR